jgi:hypothetical protein
VSTSLSVSDDYAVMDVGPYQFYYGYEYLHDVSRFEGKTIDDYRNDDNWDGNTYGVIVRKNNEIIYHAPLMPESRDDACQGLLFLFGQLITEGGIVINLAESDPATIGTPSTKGESVGR